MLRPSPPFATAFQLVTVTPGGEVEFFTENHVDSEATELPEIFEDGFESGDTSAWSSTVN